MTVYYPTIRPNSVHNSTLVKYSFIVARTVLFILLLLSWSSFNWRSVDWIVYSLSCLQNFFICLCSKQNRIRIAYCIQSHFYMPLMAIRWHYTTIWTLFRYSPDAGCESIHTEKKILLYTKYRTLRFRGLHSRITLVVLRCVVFDFITFMYSHLTIIFCSTKYVSFKISAPFISSLSVAGREYWNEQQQQQPKTDRLQY